MILDLLQSDNYIGCNLKLAKAVGLSSAVYCYELANILSKATRKNKLTEDGFVKLDRKYVYERTSLLVEEQLKIDYNLSQIGLIERDVDNTDLIKLDLNLLCSIIANEDLDLLDDLTSKVNKKCNKAVKETKRTIIINNIKNGIVCSNYELLTALREWVDAIYSNPKGFLSKSAVENFQNTLNNYTKGDLDLALRLVKIATIQSYKDCQWAINVYERDEKYKKCNKSSIKINDMKKATQESLSNEVF